MDKTIVATDVVISSGAYVVRAYVASPSGKPGIIMRWQGGDYEASDKGDAYETAEAMTAKYREQQAKVLADLLACCEQSLRYLTGEDGLDQDDLKEIAFATDLENAIETAKGGAA